MKWRPYSALNAAISRLSGQLRTRAARENAQLAKSARLTKHGTIDNIRGGTEFVKIGERTVISGHLQVFAHAGEIVIGDWCFVGEGSRIWSAARVTIGNRVLISHHVSIIDTSSHPIDAVARYRQTEAILKTGHPRTDPGLDSAPIAIGDDAWISFGAAILKGVKVGQGAIVGAGSVVTEDVPPWTVVAGNPARVIRKLD
jgi:acetyltransferase-like isoleucine patch superfamily enzyme